MGKNFFTDHGFRILLVVMFLLSFIWMGTKRTLLSNSNNVADWLPESFAETREYNWYLRHFPYESFVVVSWAGCTMDDGRLEMFAQKLVPGQTIDNMADWMGGVPQLGVELELPDESKTAAKTIRDNSESSTETPVRSPKEKSRTDYFKNVMTGPRLKRMLEDRYGPESSTPMLSEEQILDRLNGLLIGSNRTAPDGTPLPVEKYKTAMIVTLNKPANEKELRKVLQTIKEIGKECGVQPTPPIDTRPMAARLAGNTVTFLQDVIFGIPYKIEGLVLGGPPVDNVAIGYEGERTLYRLAGICALIGLTISMICFRSFRLTMFVFWTAILAAGIALAMVSLTGSRCDAIMLSMPALVYVLGMSGAIHIINYYHDAIREHGLEGAAERSIQLAWYPCFIASLTTAIGLASLYFSHLIPIMKFGIYAAIGVMLTLVLLFLYLPTLLHFFPSRDYAEHVALGGRDVDENTLILRFWKTVGGFVTKYNMLVMLFFLALMAYHFVGVFKIETSVKMMRFYSPNAEIIAHYGELEETLGPLVPMDVVIKFDNTRCKFNTLERLRFIEKIGRELKEKLPEEIGGVMSAATVGPSTFAPGKPKSLSRLARESAVNGQLDRSRQDLKDFVVVEGNPSFETTDPDYFATLRQLDLTETDAARLRAVGIIYLKDILLSQEGEGRHGITAEEMTVFREKAIAWEKEYGTDLWRISMRVWSLRREIDYAVFVNEVQNVVNPMVDRFLKEKFPDEIYPEHALLIEEPRKGILGMISDWCSAKYKAARSMVVPSIEEDPEAIYPVKAVYTGMVPLVYKTQHELIAGLVDSLVSAFFLIALVMAVVLRSGMAGLLAMLPNLFPVVIVFGFMGHMGILVDVGTMMTASVAMGIAVDDTMHYLTWFRAAVDQGCTPKQAAIEAYKRCATAMTETTLIGGLGLAAFAFSTFTPTQMFGVMMLTMLSVALIGDLVFLPAILTGPAGRFFVPKRKSALDPPSEITPELNETPKNITGETDPAPEDEGKAYPFRESKKQVG